jgi:hypothetical protein
MVPGNRLSLLVEPGRHSIEPIRPIHVVLDIFLARPHDLDGTIDLLRDLHGAGGTIGLQPVSINMGDIQRASSSI